MKSINISPKKVKDPLWKLIGHEHNNHQQEQKICIDLEIDTTSLEMQVQRMERNEPKNYQTNIEENQLNRQENQQDPRERIKINKLALYGQTQNKLVIKKVPLLNAQNEKMSHVVLQQEKLAKIRLCMKQLHQEMRCLKVQLIKQKQTRKIQLNSLFKLVEQHIQEFTDFFHNSHLNRSLQQKIKQQDLQICELKDIIAKLNEKSSTNLARERKEENMIQSSSIDKITVENLFKPKNALSSVGLLKHKKSQVNCSNQTDKSTKKLRYYSKKTSIQHSLSKSNADEKKPVVKEGKTFMKSKAQSFKDQSTYSNSNLKQKIDCLMGHHRHEEKNQQTMEEIAVLRIKVSKLKESIHKMQ